MHSVLRGVENLEGADHGLRAERLESLLAAGLLDDAVAPILEDLQPDAARPGRLDLPGRGLALGRADEGRADLVGDPEHGRRAACGERGLETTPPAAGGVLDSFAMSPVDRKSVV